ncbi:MAG TPA: hypothetical protein VNM47_09970 [Terriglobia bacterium]|nr:hypothetical protein [Terriglobia bacterium]
MKCLVEVAVLGLFLAGAAGPHAGSRAQQGVVDLQQQTAPESQSAAPSMVMLKEGTEVKLALAQRVTGKAAVVGEPIELALAEDLRVGNAVVARKGTRVLGTVIEGKKSEKEHRRPKSLRVRVDFIKAGEAKILVRGEQAGVGKRNKTAMAAVTAAFGLTGLLLTMGKKYEIPVGTPVIAYVDEDVSLPPLE